MKEINLMHTSLSWKLIERFSSQGIQLVIQIILARLLLPRDFGIIAILLIFLNFSNILIQSGLNIALVQKKDSDETDFSSVYWMSCFLSLILYFIVFSLAPLIGDFYKIPEIIISIRILGISLFFGPINTIYSSLIMKKMLFKEQFLSSIIGSFGYGVIGISMALLNFGFWSLVIANLTSIILTTITFNFLIKWKVNFVFSILRMKKMFSFSSKMLFSSFIFVLSDSLYGLFLGRYYSSDTLGFYNRAQKFPMLVSTSFNSAISSVIFPVLTSKQDNTFEIRKTLYNSTRTSTFIIAPLMLLMSALSESIILTLLTDKWFLAIPIMRILSIEYSISSIHTTSIQAYAAVGKSYIVLQLEIFRLIFAALSLFVGFLFGFYYIFYFRLLSAVFLAFYIIFINKKIFDYKVKQQIKSFIPNFFLSVIVYLIAFVLNFFLSINLFNTFLIATISVIIYLLLALITKNDNLNFFYHHSTQLVKSFWYLVRTKFSKTI
jgi:teichuronic acid exporter